VVLDKLLRFAIRSLTMFFLLKIKKGKKCKNQTIFVARLKKDIDSRVVYE